MKKAFLAAALVAPILASCGGPKKDIFKISGAGATFPAPLYQAWFGRFSSKTGNQVNYQAVGSGAGVRQFVKETVDFGASDAAVKDSKIPEGGMVQIPVTGGAIVPAYNVPGCDVKMTQTQLVDVFMGKIHNWSEFGCGNVPIMVVYRSDGAGTTYGFTNSLSAFSPEWKSEYGTAKTVKWPVGVGAKGNSGVAAQMLQIEGSIGYMNYNYVMTSKLEQVSLQNKAGVFLKANPTSAAYGLTNIKLDDKLRGTDPNPAGEMSYPIVSLTWILAYPQSKPGVKETLNFILSEEAQGMSDNMGYVALPENLRQKALAAVETINEEE